MRTVTTADKLRMALVTGLSLRTVERAYEGRDMRLSTLRRLFDAAKEMGVEAPPVNLPGTQEGGE